MNFFFYAMACALAAGVPPPSGSSATHDEGASAPLIEDGKPSIADGTTPEPSPLPAEYKTLFQNEDIKVNWGGQIFYDWGWFSADDGYPAGDADGAEFRTARLWAEGTIYEKVRFKAQYDFAGNAGSTAALKDVWMAIDTFVGELMVGHFKEPFSLEQLTSSRFITFEERSLHDVFTPARTDGIQLSGANEAASLNWALGLFRDDGGGDSGFDTGDGENSVTGRIAGTLFNRNEGADVLHLGVSATVRQDQSGTVTFADRPEAHLLNKIPYATFASDGFNAENLEAAWVRGPLSLQGEYALTQADVAGAPDADFSGTYAQVSYFLTGEHRNYKAKGAKFDRVKPAENFDGHGFGGAWELAARFSMNDFDDGPSTNQTTNYTAGVNWYLNPNTRVMLNYIHSNYEDDPANLDENGDFLTLRFQVDW